MLFIAMFKDRADRLLRIPLRISGQATFEPPRLPHKCFGRRIRVVRTISRVQRVASPLLTTVPLLIIDDLGTRKLPLTAAEELLEIIMRR
jgi:hypothetical protein